MELRRYWQVLVDRAAIVGGTSLVALLVAAASVYLLPQSLSSYQASLSLALRPQPLPPSATPFFSDDYYSYVASEYANDDLIAILESADFLQAVRARLASAPGGAPDGSIQGKKAHRVVEITVSSSTAPGALALARTVADLLTAKDAQSTYFSLLTNREITATLVDGPRLVAQPAGRNALLNLVARALVGLAAGIALAFLVEYLDDTVRPDEVEALLGWPVLAEVPGRALPRRTVEIMTPRAVAAPEPDRRGQPGPVG